WWIIQNPMRLRMVALTSPSFLMRAASTQTLGNSNSSMIILRSSGLTVTIFCLGAASSRLRLAPIPRIPPSSPSSNVVTLSRSAAPRLYLSTFFSSSTSSTSCSVIFNAKT
ncbi:hypothetical protein PENTCL1PPCAC_22982, partial [Pristionchus entomophagus]